MKYTKRGQISIFIILAIVLVYIIVGIFWMINNNKQSSMQKDFFNQANVKPTMDSIRNNIIDCRDNSIKNSLKTIGIQGGYYDKPGKYFDLKWAFIPYYYYQGAYSIPTKTIIEKELQKSIDKEFTDCINNVKFENFEITHEVSKSKATIKNGEVDVTIDMPISIKRESNVQTLEMKDAETSQISKLYDIIDLASAIAESHKEDSKLICISCVGKMAEQKDLYVDFVQFSEYNTLAIIIDNVTSSQPYTFEFLNKYTGNEKPSEVQFETEPVPNIPQMK